MKQDKSDILFSLLSIWGILLFMIFFSLAGKAGAYEEYARAQAAGEEAMEQEAGKEAFADRLAESSDGAKYGEEIVFRNADPVSTRQKVGASVIVAVGAVTLTVCGVVGSRKMREKQEK